MKRTQGKQTKRAAVATTEPRPGNGDAGSGPDWPGVLTRLRRECYLSQQAIAEACGVAPQTVSAWKGRRRVPGLYAARKLLELCRANGVTLDLAEVVVTGSTNPGAHDATAPVAGDPASDEQRLLALYRQAPAELRPGLLAFAAFVAARPCPRVP